MVYELRHQPIKGLYLTFEALSIVFILIPWWTLRNIPQRFRARPSWTLKKAVMVSFLARMQLILSRTDNLFFVADHETVSQGSGIKLVWVNPAPSSLLNDMLKSWMTIASVSPVPIPGYWIDRSGLDTPIGAPTRPHEKILYHFHGGGYTRLSASSKDVMASISRGILVHAASARRAFALEYRLSKTAPYPAESPFPAALLDALAGYVYLVRDAGIAPEDIVLVGDSAGGNLAHALTRYLIEHPMLGLPPPGAVLLLSPCLDMSESHNDDPNTAVDYLGPRESPWTVWSRRAFFGPLGEDIQFSRYLSPASVDPRAEEVSFVGWPRTMVVSGGAESLLQSIREVVKRMRRDIGEEVTYYEAEDAVHDYLPFKFWEPENTQTLKAIAKWIGDR